jgi:hypothetical protein
MTKQELYVPSTEHGLQIADRAHIEPVEVLCTEFDEMYDTICGIEFALGLRFGTDVNEYGVPIVGVNTATWDLLENLRTTKYATKPKELFVTVSGLADESAKARLVTPSPIAGHKKEAITAEFGYVPKTVKSGYSTVRKLGRKSLLEVKIRPNPYYQDCEQADPHAVRTATTNQYRLRGVLGTR